MIPFLALCPQFWRLAAATTAVTHFSPTNSPQTVYCAVCALYFLLPLGAGAAFFEPLDPSHHLPRCFSSSIFSRSRPVAQSISARHHRALGLLSGLLLDLASDCHRPACRPPLSSCLVGCCHFAGHWIVHLPHSSFLYLFLTRCPAESRHRLFFITSVQRITACLSWPQQCPTAQTTTGLWPLRMDTVSRCLPTPAPSCPSPESVYHHCIVPRAVSSFACRAPARRLSF